MFRFLVLRQSFSKKLWSCSVGFQLSEFRWRCFRDGYIRILPGKIPINLPAALQGPCLSTSVLIWQRSFCSATVVKALGTWALGHLALCIFLWSPPSPSSSPVSYFLSVTVVVAFSAFFFESPLTGNVNGHPLLLLKCLTVSPSFPTGKSLGIIVTYSSNFILSGLSTS